MADRNNYNPRAGKSAHRDKVKVGNLDRRAGFLNEKFVTASGIDISYRETDGFEQVVFSTGAIQDSVISSASTLLGAIQDSVISSASTLLSKVSQTTAPMTLYLNTDTGNDLADGLTEGTARLTWAAVWALVPDYRKHDVTINIAGGTPIDTITLTGVQADGALLLIQGTNWTLVDDNGGLNFTATENRWRRVWQTDVQWSVNYLIGFLEDMAIPGSYWPVLMNGTRDVRFAANISGGALNPATFRFMRPEPFITLVRCYVTGSGRVEFNTLYFLNARLFDYPYRESPVGDLALVNCVVSYNTNLRGGNRVKIENTVLRSAELYNIRHLDLRTTVAGVGELEIIASEIRNIESDSQFTGTVRVTNSWHRGQPIDDLSLIGATVLVKASSLLLESLILQDGSTLTLDGTRLEFTNSGTINHPRLLLPRGIGVWSLLNDLRAMYNAHLALEGGVHGSSDVINVSSAAALWWGDTPETMLEAAFGLADDIRTAYEAHRVFLTDGVHGAADTTNVVTAAVVRDLQSLFLLVNDLRAQFEAHRVLEGGVHGAPDATNVITVTATYDAATYGLIAKNGSVVLPFLGHPPCMIGPSGDITTDDVAELAKWIEIDHGPETTVVDLESLSRISRAV